jgi:Domain of unknown function (DUF4838)
MKCRKPVFTLLFFLIATNFAFSKIPLVKNGKSNYKIIIPVQASLQEERAAFLFQKYIGEISDCILPIEKSNNAKGHYIFLKESNNHPHSDAFTIKTKANSLLVDGGSGKGLVYGVLELLEKYLGCHYYSYYYKIIPKNKNILLPEIDISDAPKNDLRIVHTSEKFDEEFLDWHRLHTQNNLFGRGYYVHTFNKLVPWQEYFKPHPEYYAYMNGKRIIDQLCLSNADVLKLSIEKLKKEMKEQPDRSLWSVSQDDNFSYCQCDGCKKIIEDEKSPAGPVIRFVNEVAKQFPDKTISTLAYQYSRQAPVKTKPESNVQIMLCTIELNRSKPIETDPTSQSFVKDIKDWGKLSRNIYLWDYEVDFAHTCSPFPNLHTLQPNIQFFVKNNVRQHFQQSNISRGQEFSELKMYLLARLLWNPDANVNNIVNEFINGYYGAAAPWIRKYIDQMQAELISSNAWLDIYGHPVAHHKTFLSEKNVQEYFNYFDEAIKAVKGDSALLMHVRMSQLPLQYATMEIGKNDMFGSRGWYNEGNYSFPKKEMTDMLEDFYSVCKTADVTHLNESGLKPKDYYESTRRFIEVQVVGNFAFRKKITADVSPAKKYSSGDLTYLTNGVRGASDFKVHWLGWEAKNVSLIVDLESTVTASQIEISSLWDAKSWILHPATVSCFVSNDGINYLPVGKIENKGNQQKEELTRLYSFKPTPEKYRYIKFDIDGTLKLPDWHPSAGGGSWVFIDEIVVK